MQDLIQNAFLLSIPLLCLGIVRYFLPQAWKVPILIVLIGISFIIPIYLKISNVEEIWLLFTYTGNFEISVSILCVILLWNQIYINGGLGDTRNAVINCFVKGMSIGMHAAQNIEGTSKPSKHHVFYMILGSCFGVLGNPLTTALFPHINNFCWYSFWSVLLCLILWSARDENPIIQYTSPNKFQILQRILFACVSIAILSYPSLTLEILVLTNLLLLPISLFHYLSCDGIIKKQIFTISTWYFASVFMVNISIIAGTAELISWILEETQYNYGVFFPVATIMFTLIAGTLLDSIIVLILCSAIFANALNLVHDNSTYAIVIGTFIAYIMNFRFNQFQSIHRLKYNHK